MIEFYTGITVYRVEGVNAFLATLQICFGNLYHNVWIYSPNKWLIIMWLVSVFSTSVGD